MQRKTRLDEQTNRWYLKLTRYELKEIRAKYWQYPEAVVAPEVDALPFVEGNLEGGTGIDFFVPNADKVKKMMTMDQGLVV